MQCKSQTIFRAPQPLRHIQNTLPDYSSNVTSQADILTPEINETLTAYLQNYLNQISTNYSPEDTHVKGYVDYFVMKLTD